MLTSLSLSNFKSWKRIDRMQLAPITGLFGTNSSGKSAILQLLLLLKQTKEAADRAQALHLGDPSTYVNLGTFRDLIHNHDEDASLNWKLAWQTEERMVITDPQKRRRDELFSGQDLSVGASIEIRRKIIATRRISYEFGGHKFSLEPKKPEETAYKLAIEPASGFRFIRTQGRPWDLPGPEKCYAFPDQVRTYYQNAGFLPNFELAFEQQIDKTFYLGPLREFPKREYLWGGGRPTDVGKKGEKVIDAILAARAGREKIHRGRGKKIVSLEEYVARWLKDMEIISKFHVEEIAEGSNIYKVNVQKTPSSSLALLPDVGFGVSQVLPVLILLFYVPEGSTVLLEQPEIHLHPLVQSELADVLIDAVKVRNIQIIVESHSEHMLMRLQRRIAEGILDIDQTALYFCDLVNGSSRLTPLQVDLYGNISNWPEQFFGDDFGEIAATQEAATKRRMAAAE